MEYNSSVPDGKIHNIYIFYFFIKLKQLITFLMVLGFIIHAINGR